MSEQTEANKLVVQRLVDHVLNGGDLDLVDELYEPALLEDNLGRLSQLGLLPELSAAE